MTLPVTSVNDHDNQIRPPPRILFDTFTGLSAIIENTAAICHLRFGCHIQRFNLHKKFNNFKELMLQQLPIQDQQQHLATPPKDPSSQRPALDLDSGCPGTSSGLHKAPSEPTNPSFDQPPFVWSHVQPFPAEKVSFSF